MSFLHAPSSALPWTATRAPWTLLLRWTTSSILPNLSRYASSFLLLCLATIVFRLGLFSYCIMSYSQRMPDSYHNEPRALPASPQAQNRGGIPAPLCRGSFLRSSFCTYFSFQMAWITEVLGCITESRNVPHQRHRNSEGCLAFK